jgi:hypothetical protein
MVGNQLPEQKGQEVWLKKKMEVTIHKGVWGFSLTQGSNRKKNSDELSWENKKILSQKYLENILCHINWIVTYSSLKARSVGPAHWMSSVGTYQEPAVSFLYFYELYRKGEN